MSYTVLEIKDPKAFQERLITLRVERGLSQRDMAFEGCSHSFLSRIETGDRMPTLEIVEGLAKVLGVSPHYLLTGDEDSLAAVALQVVAEIEGGVEPPKSLIRKLKSLASAQATVTG
jgi:transcriptional regulator with XRE-family HTH domain